MKLGKGFRFFCALTALLVIASVVFGVLNFIGLRKMAEAKEDEENLSKEDGITIAEEFTVESTLPVSEAYISGDTSRLDDRQKETLEMAEKVIKSEIKSDMTDYDKELAIYKYLTVNMNNDTGLLTVIPTSHADSDNPYGVLKNRNAVCVGYATTFRLFMQMMGIDCKVVHSTDLTHTWDLVKIGGDWYHVDCYMDSGSGNLKSFNMDDTLCSQSHDWDNEFFPAATGTEYNPLIKNAESVASVYDIPKWFKEHIDSEDKSFSGKFKNMKEQDENVARYITDGIVSGISWTDDSSDYYESVWTMDSDGNYILCVFFNRDNSEAELPDEQKEKANEAIYEYFPDISLEGDGDDYETDTSVYDGEEVYG
ncbi:MAG: transglutaminase domain-containing protein [Clostridia bacterium]|nr:transglutaminase domain-containing protein [Clostridia bacterium]